MTTPSLHTQLRRFGREPGQAAPQGLGPLVFDQGRVGLPRAIAPRTNGVCHLGYVLIGTKPRY